MGVRENKVEKYLNTEIKKLGGITRKWVSPGHSGVPDRIIIIKGLIMFVEVKTLEGKLSVAQERELQRLTDNGASALVIFGKPGVDDLIKSIEGVLENVNDSDATS